MSAGSLSRNIVANYISQIYIILISILILPLYVRYMGAEAYGLIGFFSTIQVFFNLLDMGLTPALVRETARFRGGAADANTYRRFVRVLEVIFLVTALVCGGLMNLTADYIARNWLQVSRLPIDEVYAAIQLMVTIAAIRWVCGLYRGVVSGFEMLVWLGGYNSFIATMRFVCVLPILIFVGATPKIFFYFQLCVALVELGGLLFYTYSLLPKYNRDIRRMPWSWEPLKPILKFSLTYTLVSSAWVLMTQTDKLILSRILPLADYGYFSLAVVIAGGVTMIGSAVGSAIIPHIVKLDAEDRHEELISVYRQTTQLVTVFAGGASVTLAMCAEPFLWVWTGDRLLARHVAPILIPYVIGNGILTVAAFPYYLQYAKGNLRLHVLNSLVFMILMIPLITWAASMYGGAGAGYVWLGMNLISFVFWIPFVHHKFAPGINFRWYTEDIIVIISATALTCYVTNAILPYGNSRLMQAGEILIMGFSVLIAGTLASSAMRARSKAMVNQLQKTLRLRL